MSYSKGCYIGQEVLNRIHTIGHVNRHLHVLKLTGGQGESARAGDKLFRDGREVGYLTSVAKSSKMGEVMALGYVRNASEPGTTVIVRTASGEIEGLIRR